MSSLALLFLHRFFGIDLEARAANAFRRLLSRLRTLSALIGGLSLVVSGLLASTAVALDVPPLSRRVNDVADVLPEARERLLEQKLASFEQATGQQFAVLTIPSLEGDPIEDFAIRVVEKWKLGRAKKDDGLLLLVAVDDHQVRIEVGYGLEGVIPDALAGRVVDSILLPHFREGDYAGGIELALEQLMRLARGEASDLPRAPPRSTSRAPNGFVWLIFLVFLILGSLLPRRRSGLFSAGRGFGYGGFGGFGAGSGGGFRGGGGGFGGGGASGRW